MKTSATKLGSAVAVNVDVTDEILTVELSDGHALSVPVKWFPRLVHGTVAERNDWRLIGKGQGIHWEQLAEDSSVEGLIAGRSSAESASSIKLWLNGRKRQSLNQIAEPPARTSRRKS